MNTKQPESARRREGIFLLCLPALILPILGLLAWNSPTEQDSQSESKGLNLEIPSPSLEKKQSSKADAYQAAQKNQKNEENWSTPDFLNQSILNTSEKELIPASRNSFSLSSNYQAGSNHYPAHLNETEKIIQERLQVLDQAVQGSDSAPFSPINQVEINRTEERDPQLMQLQMMMDQLLESKEKPDPEIQQLEGLMDKILQLQYPENYPVGEKKATQEFEPVPVSFDPFFDKETTNSKDLTTESKQLSNGFFGLEMQEQSSLNELSSVRKTIEATVSRSQEIIPGEALELVLEQDLSLVGQSLPQGTVIYAKTSLEGSRLQVQVSGILLDRVLIPVALKGYGLDGIPGIELSDIKGASQWIKSSGQSVQSMNMNMLGMDWQSQLANSGIQATRNLIRTKSKVRKIEIKAGHPLLLIDSSTAKSQTL